MRLTETLTNLQKFLSLLNPALNLSNMLTTVAQQLVEIFNVAHSGMLLFGETDMEGVVIAQFPLQGAIGLNVPLTNYPLADRLKIEHEPIAVWDAQNDPLMGQARPTMRFLDIKSILIIGDVSGKSIQAAMLMAAAQSVVKAKGSDHRSPAKVLTETNTILYDDVPSGFFVALSYALITPNEGIVCLSNGGQLAPFLIPANGNPLRLIEPPGNHFPLGVVPDSVYDEIYLTLAPGDTLVFYTDGLVEEHSPDSQLFGFEGVAATLETLRDQSPQATLDALVQTVNEFAGGVGPHDDITVLVIQFGDYTKNRMKT